MTVMKDDWYKLCRIYLEFINPRQRADAAKWEEYIDKSVEAAAEAGLNALAFDPYYGGYALFKGSAAPGSYNLGEADIFGMVEQAVHRRGMKLVAFSMGMHFQAYASSQYPGWLQRDSEGRPVGYSADWILMCPNSPFSNYLIQDYGRLMSRYPIDALYMEGLYFGDDACYCPYCRERYLRVHGRDMLSKDASGIPAGYARFRADSLTDFVRRVRRTIDERSPQTVWMASPSHFGDDWVGPNTERGRLKEVDFASWARYIDVAHVERQWGYPTKPFFPLRNVGQSVQILKAETRKPVFGTTWISKGVDQDYSQRSPAHFRLNVAEILLYGATPQVHVQNALEVDQTLLPELKEMYRFTERLRPHLLGSKLAAYAAILIDWSSFKPSESFKGFYKALAEAHVPFEVISKADIGSGALDSYRVVILPDIGWLEEKLVRRIEAHVAGGGGLVMTYRTTCTDSSGILQERMTLGPLAGIEGVCGILTNPPGMNKSIPGSREYGMLPHHYCMASNDHEIGAGLRNRTLSFMGSFVEVDVAPSAKVVARVIDYDYEKMRSAHGVPGWYPSTGQTVAPLILAREHEGGGRVVYIAGGLDSAFLREGDAEAAQFLIDSVRWAGKGEMVVEAACPSTVELATHRDETGRSLLVFMVNQTTNQLCPDPVREVIPVKDVVVRIRNDRKLKSVTCLAGGSVACARELGYLKLVLAELKEYEAIAIELAG